MNHSRDSGHPPPSKKQKRGSNDPPELDRLRLMNLESSFPFLQLPAEIRNQIYELCVVVDGTINPYPAPSYDRPIVTKGQSKPLVALLRVSKLVNAEARPILYGRNTWHLNLNCVDIGQYQAAFMRQTLWENINSPRLAHTPIGHVTMMFSFRDLNSEKLRSVYTAWARTQHLRQPGNNPPTPPMKIAHHHLWQVLCNIWHLKARAFVELVNRPQPPKKLTLDFTECYCQAGCCRPVNRVLDILMLMPRHWPTGFASDARKTAYMERLRNIRVDITGILDAAESKRVGEKGFPARVQTPPN
ncbi:MAG: hypothetical protein LQ349_008599 [Xanthoria aureola]|nr:MAG: hypothetical protein LQ349_008599 [Xanthoria aureola]